MRLSGAEIAIKVLEEHGVDTVFGYPGANVLELYSALARSSVRHVLTSSEAGAAHAADGFARASGRTAVCIATSGPGATNLVTGIATAYMDSSPIVFITGNVPRAQVGTDSFQEVDITGITLPITKWNVLVQSTDDLADALRTAFRIAREGRPGPVLVDIPRDVAQESCDYEPSVPATPKPSKIPTEDALARAAELIGRSERPIILAGGGAKGAATEVDALAKRLGCPIVTTLMGIGASTRSIGFVGRDGSPRANAAFRAADLVIAVGARFSDRIARPFEDTLNLVHIDIDRAEIGKNVAAAAFVEADAATALRLLTPRLPRREWTPPSIAAAPRAVRGGVSPSALGLVRRHFADAIVATDVGEHQIWAARAIAPTDPHSFLTSGGMGTMGFGLGAAIGASIAAKSADIPAKKVVLVTGDGSFMMNMNELATAVRLGADITILLMRNRTLGMVRRSLRRGERGATELERQPDFLRLAKSFGARAYRARSDAELDARLADAARHGGVTLIECRVGRDTHI